MAICKVIDFARKHAIITGSDVLSRQVVNGSRLYYEIYDYENGHSNDPSLHASIARQVIRIALCTAAKLTHSPPPSELVNDNILYVDGKRVCDLRDVRFKLVQMTIDGKTAYSGLFGQYFREYPDNKTGYIRTPCHVL